MTQITDHHTSISNDSAAVLEEAKALYKELFPLTPSFIDKEGNRIRLWSTPGPTVVATIQKTNGIFQYVSKEHIKNGLNPKDSNITLHNLLLYAPPTESNFDLVKCSNGNIVIWPLLSAGGWQEAMPRGNDYNGIIRLARGRTQEQMCQWFYSNGFHPENRAEPIYVSIHLRDGGYVGTFNCLDHETIRNVLHQGAIIKHLEIPPLKPNDKEGLHGRGIVFSHPKDQRKLTFNLDCSIDKKENGSEGKEFKGGYHIDVRGKNVEKVKASTIESYLANRLVPETYKIVFRNLQFQQALQQTKLTDSYNATHPQKPIPAKGVADGKIGGVACGIEYIEGIFNGAEALFESEHFFCLPMIDGNLPCTNGQLRQILRELAIGIYTHSTVPFFSLHFRQGSADLFPVIHPTYQHTLVGRVISMLDYFMKGYLNGGVFPEDFVDSWHEHPTWEGQEGAALARLLDFEAYCQKHLKDKDVAYLSARKLTMTLQGIKMLGLFGEAGSHDSEILQEFDGFKNSFRIIAKQNSFRKEGNVFIIDPDFDVLYTIAPSLKYTEAMERHIRETGTPPLSYQLIEESYKLMSRQIHDHMVKMPLCREYFAMLGIINFFSSYFLTLKQHGKLPTLPPCSVVDGRGCPPLFPHLPLFIPMQESLKMNQREIIRDFFNDPIAKKFIRHLFLHDQQKNSEAILQCFERKCKQNLIKHCSPPFQRFLKGQEQVENLSKELSNQLFNNLCTIVKQIGKAQREQISENLEKHLKPNFLDLIIEKIVERTPNNSLDVTKKISFITSSLPSESPKQSVEKNHRVVGGCGMQLEKSTVKPAPQVAQVWRQHWQDLYTLEPETWERVNIEPLGEGIIFSLPFEDTPTEASQDYMWMEEALFLPDGQENLTLVRARVEIEEAMHQANHQCFLEHIERIPHLNLLRQRNGASLLHIAATFQDPFYLDALLKKNISSRLEDLDGYLPIHYAASAGSHETLRLLLNKDSSESNHRGKNGSSPLICAIQANQVESVRILLNFHPSHSLLSTGYTDLHCALHQGNVEIIGMLFREERIVTATLNEKSEEGGTPLMLACALGNPEFVEKLLTLGADPLPAMEVAVRLKSPSILRMLLQRAPASPIALETAAIEGNREIMECLASAYPLQNYRNACKDNLLHLALRHNNTAVALYLSHNSFLRNQSNHENDTPMRLAILLGIWNIAEALYNQGVMPDLEDLLHVPYHSLIKHMFASVTLSTDQLNAFLFIALQAKNYLLVSQVLLPKGASLSSIHGPKGWKAIHYLAKADAIFLFGNEIIKTSDSLMRLKEDNNQTLPYIAAQNGSSRVFSLLLQKMKTDNISLENHYNDRHLFYAVIESGDVNMVSETLEYFPHLVHCFLDSNHTLPVHLAAQLGLEKIVELLLEKGSLANQNDLSNHTPLYYALRVLSTNIAEKILEHDPLITGEDLYLAAQLPASKFLLLLMQKKPSQESLDEALHLAVLYHHPDAFSILCKQGASSLYVSSLLHTPIMEANFQALIQTPLFYTPEEIAFITALTSKNLQQLLQTIQALAHNTKIFMDHKGKRIWGTPLQLLLRAMQDETPILPLVEELLNIPGQDFSIPDSEGDIVSHLLVRAGISLFICPNLPLTIRNHKGETPLHLAAGKASTGELEKLLKILPPEECSARTDAGKTPIFYAIQNEKVENLSLLIDRGSYVNIRDHVLLTPLFLACKLGSLIMTRLLMARGANPNQTITAEGLLLLQALSLKHHREIIFCLIRNGAQLDISDRNGMHLFHNAAQLGDVELIRLMHARGVCLDINDNKGLTAKHHAALRGQTDVLQAIANLEHSSFEIPAEQSQKDLEEMCELEGITPLHLATLHGNVETTSWLLDHGCNIEAKIHDRENVLGLASSSPAAPSLLQLFTPYKIAHDIMKALSAIESATAHDNVDALIFLYGKRLSINASLRRGNTGLHFASMHGAVQCTAWLLQNGANPWPENEEGKNAFEIAAEGQSARQLQVLLKITGIDPDFVFFSGKTLLHLATQAGGIQQILCLVALGADLNILDQIRGMSPLHYAIEMKNAQLTSLLLACGASLTLLTNDGKSPLDITQEANIELKAIIDAHQVLVSEAGIESSSLHLAVLSRNIPAVMALAQISDLSIRNEKGCTALDLAIATEQFYLCKILKTN
ncbi:MAG: ankyrin repeat domain-containing protein [Chlamydiales bacterium]|nr:ankyrin repeat domain-containing protein [Chlamydiales bacterium]